MGQADKYRLKVADNVLDGLVTTLCSKADELVAACRCAKRDTGEVDKIVARFRLVVPASNCKTLADILDAAWIAYSDDTLWSDIPQIARQKQLVLLELVLKNIEIFEVEQILKEIP